MMISIFKFSSLFILPTILSIVFFSLKHGIKTDSKLFYKKTSSRKGHDPISIYFATLIFGIIISAGISTISMHVVSVQLYRLLAVRQIV